MSNTFTSTPTLVDPGRLTASQTIRSTEIARLSDLVNYCFAVGGTHNVLTQIYDDTCFLQDSTSYVQMAQWIVPRISNVHNTLIINMQGYCPSASNATARLTYTIDSTDYSVEISITDQGRYTSKFNQGSISITGTHDDAEGVLKLEVKAPSGSQAVILGIQANWQALTSPLSTGQLLQYSDVFTPQGQARQGDDQPLTARWGVEMLENINTLRRRPRVLFNWSGVQNTSPQTDIDIEASAPKGIGRGDLSSFYSEVAIFGGTVEDSTLYLRVWTKLENYTSGSINLEVMGNTLTLNSSSWQSHDIEFVLDEVARSNQFGLSMYHAGVDNTRIQINAVSSTLRPPSTFPYIAGLCIIGV